MTIHSGMRPIRRRVPTSIEDGGTGARTAQEAVAALNVPSLDGDNTFTGTNEFRGTLQSTGGIELTLPSGFLNVIDDGGQIQVLDFSSLSNGWTWEMPNGSGTLALLSDITASSGGSGVDVTVDFGSTFAQYATTTVTGQTWVASGSKIVATLKASSGKAMEGAVLSFSCVVSDLVAGTGFTLSVFAPYKAKGTYTFSCVGV